VRFSVPGIRIKRCACLLALPALFGSVPARAQCNRPDLRHAIPADGVTGVPTNGLLRAAYATTAEWINEEVVLHRSDDATPLPGTINFSKAEGLLAFQPDQPLDPGTEYVIEWPKLRGLNTASLGRGKTVTFRTGEGEDVEPPSFEGLIELDWDVAVDEDDCTDTHEDRFVFDLTLGQVSDDSGRDLLALVIHQTAGPLLNPDGPEQLTLRALPPPGEKVRVVQTISKGEGRVCFAATVRDSLENARSGQSVQCTETVEPPFFDGCALSRSRAPGGSNALSVLLVAGAVFLASARRTRRFEPQISASGVR
jgi:hypothetical protein